MISFKGWRVGINPDTASDVAVVFSVDEGKTWANLPLDLTYVNHSPTGFNWGYHGSGPAQLGFAILSKYLTKKYEFSKREAYELLCDGIYQRFKSDIVSRWGREWLIEDKEINEWLCNNDFLPLDK